MPYLITLKNPQRGSEAAPGVMTFSGQGVGSPRLLEGPEGSDLLPEDVHRDVAAGEAPIDPETELVADLSTLLGDVHLQVEGARDAIDGGAVHGDETLTTFQQHGELAPAALEADGDAGGELGEGHGRVQDRQLGEVTLIVLGMGPAEAELAHDLLGLAQAVVAIGHGLQGEDGATIVQTQVIQHAAGGRIGVVDLGHEVEPAGHGLQVRRVAIEAGGEPGVLHLIVGDHGLDQLAGLQAVVARGPAVGLALVRQGQVGAVDDRALLPGVGGGGETGVGLLAGRGVRVGVHASGGQLAGGGIGVHVRGGVGVRGRHVAGGLGGGRIRVLAGGGGLAEGAHALGDEAAGHQDGQEGEGGKGESGHTVSSVWHNGGRSSRGDPKISSSLSWSSRMEDMS